MFDGMALSGLFDGDATPPDIDLPLEGFDLSSGSFSMHLDPGYPCEFASSVTLTVLLESPGPSVDAFVAAPYGTWIGARANTFFPAGKASLSATEKAGLSEAAAGTDRTAIPGTTAEADRIGASATRATSAALRSGDSTVPLRYGAVRVLRPLTNKEADLIPDELSQFERSILRARGIPLPEGGDLVQAGDRILVRETVTEFTVEDARTAYFAKQEAFEQLRGWSSAADEIYPELMPLFDQWQAYERAIQGIEPQGWTIEARQLGLVWE